MSDRYKQWGMVTRTTVYHSTEWYLLVENGWVTMNEVDPELRVVCMLHVGKPSEIRSRTWCGLQHI